MDTNRHVCRLAYGHPGEHRGWAPPPIPHAQPETDEERALRVMADQKVSLLPIFQVVDVIPEGWDARRLRAAVLNAIINDLEHQASFIKGKIEGVRGAMSMAERTLRDTLPAHPESENRDA